MVQLPVLRVLERLVPTRPLVRAPERRDGQLVFDIGQAVADGTPKLAMLLDDDNAETDSLANGANSQVDNGESGGATKPKQFMQHPPWDGRVGNTISRYEIALPAVDTTAVEAGEKSATTWGRLKAN